jgi:hypothetical protein
MTHMTGEPNILLEDPMYDQLSDAELKSKMAEKAVPVRARALGALARRAGSDPALLEYVGDAIRDPLNQKLVVMGVVSVSYLGLYGLFLTKNEACLKKANALYAAWPPDDRQTLREWLESEGIQF